jgi:methionyl-tRNA formyltransferase
MQAQSSAVKRAAIQHGLEVFQPASLKTPESQARVLGVSADALIVAAYGLLLPAPLLAVGTRGAINIHASLLPRWRGAAPIQRALLAGDTRSGISIMQMDAGLDTGAVLAERAIAINADDDAGSLHDRLAALGAQMIVEVLRAPPATATPQAESGATYARKIEKRETFLDWSRPALELERAVRAFRPAPGAAAHLEGEPIKVWSARLAEGTGDAGVVLAADDALVVACGEGALALTELQRAGGKRLPAAQFLRGRPLGPGARLSKPQQ